MTIIKADVKPVPHRHIGIEAAAQDIGIKGIVGAERLGDGGSDLHDADVIAFHLIAPDHEWLQTQQEGILNPWINPLLDGDFFVACPWTKTHRVGPRSISCGTQGANKTGTIEVHKTRVLPALERWTDRQVLLAVGVLADVEIGRACAIKILD